MIRNTPYYIYLVERHGGCVSPDASPNEEPITPPHDTLGSNERYRARRNYIGDVPETDGPSSLPET